MAVARRERFEALFNYTPHAWDEIELEKGDIVQCVERFSDGWMLGVSERTSKAGKCPGNFLQKIVKTPETRAIPKPLERTSSTESRDSSIKKRANIAEEIVSTERSYVKHLHQMQELYYEPLKKKGLLKPEELATIFPNVQSLLGINETLLKDLDERVKAWDAQTTTIGDVFKRMAPFLKLYETYCNQHGTATQMLSRCQTKSENFSSFLKTTAASCFQTLDSLLLMPIQRIPRYNLLLEDLLKHTPEEHPDAEKLTEAVVSLRKISYDLNENIRRIENERRIIAIGQLFVPNDSVDLIDASRQFFLKKVDRKARAATIEGEDSANTAAPHVYTSRTYQREGTLLVEKVQSLKTVERYFFLFNDLLLVARVKGPTFKLKERAVLSQCWLADSVLDATKAFELGTPKKSYQLIASSTEEKARWFADLSRCISQQKEQLYKYVSLCTPRDSFGSGKKMKALVDYTGSDVELSFKADEVIIYTPLVYESGTVSEEWGQGIANGVFGWFPLACVVRPEPEHDPSLVEEYKLSVNDILCIQDRVKAWKAKTSYGTTSDGAPRSNAVLQVHEVDGTFKSFVVPINATAKEAVAILLDRLKRADNPDHYVLCEVAGEQTERRVGDLEQPVELASNWYASNQRMKFLLRTRATDT